MSDREHKFGISTTLDYTVAIRAQVDFIAGAGFDFISMGADLKHSRFTEPQLFRATLDYVRDKGLFIESAHAPFGDNYDLAHADTEMRKTAIAILESFCGQCADYDIPIVIVHPHHYFSDSPDECLERASDSIKRLLAVKPQGVQIALENLPGAPSARIFAQLMERFEASQCGFCYDSSHENISGRPFQLLEKYYNRLTTCHLSDNHGERDEHLIPGDGTIEWPQIRKFVEMAENMKNILFEVGTGKKLTEEPGIFINRAMGAARKIFGRG